jgi:hypothetical protein
MHPRCGRTRLAILVLLAVLPFTATQAAADADEIDWAKEKKFWSFRAPELSAPPEVKNRRWPRKELDYFVLAKLEAKSLTPSREAGKRTLIRRVTLDLSGLPPTPAEVDAFLADTRPDAYERLVERLLASERFGERLASFYLPLARYAEDQAHQVGSDTKFFYPNAYKYRDWVIDAFNRDLPYNEFIALQLAADKFDQPSDLPALGFLGLGPKYYNRNRIEVMADEWEDRVDTVTRTFLGLTVACARCHDHKFDPITTGDYYGLAGVFASTKMVNKTAEGETEPSEKKEKSDKETKDEKAEQAAKAAKEKLAVKLLHIVEDDKPQDLNVFIRGNVERKGPVAPRRFIQILAPGTPRAFSEGSGRRELAEAIVSESNPLTARVIANRMWGLIFGQPLVKSASNFGHYGDPPSHPKLLDTLAVRFRQNGWSLKSLAREFVLSATYRQDSQYDRRSAAMDPANEHLWRMNRRRLSIEQWRDSVLFVGNELQDGSGQSLELDDPKNLRRTVHARVSRLQLNSLLMQFDYPDANVHAEHRSTTTTAIQKLFLLNSPFMLERAEAVARNIADRSANNDPARVRTAYLLLFNRTPEPEELTLALGFLRKPDAGKMSRWAEYIQMLLASNEMMYVD